MIVFLLIFPFAVLCVVSDPLSKLQDEFVLNDSFDYRFVALWWLEKEWKDILSKYALLFNLKLCETHPDHLFGRDKGPEGTYLRHNHGDEIAGKEKIKQWYPKDRILFDTSIFGHPQAAAKLSFSTAKEDGDPTPWLRGTRL